MGGGESKLAIKSDCVIKAAEGKSVHHPQELGSCSGSIRGVEIFLPKRLTVETWLKQERAIAPPHKCQWLGYE
jgi:hypothetical protein